MPQNASCADIGTLLSGGRRVCMGRDHAARSAPRGLGRMQEHSQRGRLMNPKPSPFFQGPTQSLQPRRWADEIGRRHAGGRTSGTTSIPEASA